MHPTSTSRPAGTPGSRPPPLRPPLLPTALAILLALALAQAAAARAYAPADTKTAYPAAQIAALDSLLPDLPLTAVPEDEDEVQLAMLQIGPMLYGLALEEGYDLFVRRDHARKSMLWLGIFVLLVTVSAAARERQALERRRAWRRRAEGLYE
jgi:hypothetical protein